jgi:Holliday junction resolvase-like predicted endonuclease
VICRLAGFEVQGEVHTDKGRIDVVLRHKEIVVVVEIKYSKDKKGEDMLNKAMDQIREKKYYEKYSK